MITSEQLATITIRSAIFHDVPINSKGGTSTPTLSEVETPVDGKQKAHLQNKLVRALGSKSAYPIQFNSSSASPIPGEIRLLTKNSSGSKHLVDCSQKMANYLFEQHTGAVSPGLLCVLDIAIQGRAGAVLMKLERHEGAQLKLSDQHGKKTFAMSVLGDLVLTDSTRLFKAALFSTYRLGR